MSCADSLTSPLLPPSQQDLLLHILEQAAGSVPLVRKPAPPHGVDPAELPPGLFRAAGDA